MQSQLLPQHLFMTSPQTRMLEPSLSCRSGMVNSRAWNSLVQLNLFVALRVKALAVGVVPRRGWSCYRHYVTLV